MSIIDWLSRHSDAFHPGSREGCSHCQSMIAAFGPMPAKEEIVEAEASWQRWRRTGSKKPIPEWFQWDVWERDNFTCRDCGKRRFLTVDHIIPESKGGELTMDNAQTLCRSCNSKKGSRCQEYDTGSM